ncbi:MAG: S16 family serine protease [Candidatus Micrarchaeia archaeon]
MAARFIIRNLFIFFIVLSLSFSYCNSSILFYAPAVYGNTGSIIGINLTLIEGDGTIFVSVEPTIGTQIQESLKTASKIVHLYSPKEEKCSLLVNFNSENTQFIDGPSAGLAIAVNLYALLENRSVKNGVIFTGGIDENGIITPVGGVYEKTIASARQGYTYMIVPKLSVPEKILISKIKNKYNISIIEEIYFEDVLDFTLFNISKNETVFYLELEPKIEIEEYPFKSFKLQIFSPVVDDMLDLEKQELDNLQIPEGFDLLKEYYESVANNTKLLKEKGYYFSSANMAFLDYISISSISHMDDIDLEKKKNEIFTCLDKKNYPKKTTQNFEWIASSKLRDYWAVYQIENTQLKENMLEEEKFYLFKELMYADAWCHVSDSLLKIARENSKGEIFDESALIPHANALLFEISELKKTSEFFENRHIQTSEKLYEDGEYSASIFSSLYVLHLEKGVCNNFSDELLKSTISIYSSKNPESYWGKIYHTQGYYFMLNGDLKESCNLFSYAFAIDDAVYSMNAVQPKGQDNPFEFCFPSFIFLLLFLGIYIKIN